MIKVAATRLKVERICLQMFSKQLVKIDLRVPQLEYGVF